MRLSMVQNNGELVAGDAGIKFEMILKSQEMLCITYCITYHKPFTIHPVYHSKCLGVGSIDSMDWTFVRKLSTMKWPYILRYQYQSHDIWPWAESTAPQVKRFPPLEWIYIQVLKIPRAPIKNHPHWIPFEYFLRGILKLWTSCWPTTLDSWLSQAWLTFFF